MTQIKWKDTEACNGVLVDKLNVSQQMCPHGKAASSITGCAGSWGRCGHSLPFSTGDTHLQSCVSAGLPRARRMWMCWRVSSKGAGRCPRDSGDIFRECWGSSGGLARRKNSGRPDWCVLIPEGGNTDGRAKLSSVMPGIRRGKRHKPKYSEWTPALALAFSQSNIPHGSTIVALILEKISPFLTRPFPWALRQGWEGSHSPCSDF